MKLVIAFAVLFWLLCGLVGAWMLEGDEDLRWKTVARGPISLVKALNEEEPLAYPGDKT
jgi:hypothetical protein